MKTHPFVLLATASAWTLATPSLSGAGPERQVITSAEQLPRRVVQLPKLPSYYLDAPKAEVQALADALERDLRGDLARFDIRDAATLREYQRSLLGLAQFRGDWSAVPALVEELKRLQDKPGPRATSGTIALILAEHRTGGHDAAWGIRVRPGSGFQSARRSHRVRRGGRGGEQPVG